METISYPSSDRDKGIHYTEEDGAHPKGFVDSNYAGCEDTRKPTTRWVFTVAGGPVSCSSKRQDTVGVSTMDAEYVAGAEAAKEYGSGRFSHSWIFA